MQDQYSLSFANAIRHKIPPKIVANVPGLTILLVGEKTEKTASGMTIKEKGQIQVRGEASDINTQVKIIGIIQENAGGRQVINNIRVKREDPLKRKHGFF